MFPFNIVQFPSSIYVLQTCQYRNDIGQQLAGPYRIARFLDTGGTLASFHSIGTFPDFEDKLYKSAKIENNSAAHFQLVSWLFCLHIINFLSLSLSYIAIDIYISVLAPSLAFFGDYISLLIFKRKRQMQFLIILLYKLCLGSNKFNTKRVSRIFATTNK